MKENKLPELLRWTNASIYCYERNCICEGCIYKKTLETECLMKDTVLALFTKFGKPEDSCAKIKRKQMYVTDYYGQDTQKLKLLRKIKELRREILFSEEHEHLDIFADILNIINGIILQNKAEAQLKEIQHIKLDREINLIHQKNFKIRHKK